MGDSIKNISNNLYGFINRRGSFYLINDPKSGIILIDTGYPGSIKKILKFINKIEKGPKDISHILITHADGDHVANLNNLIKVSGAKVYMSKLTWNYLSVQKSPPHWPFPINYIAGIASKIFIKKVKEAVFINDGDILNIAGGIRVVNTPGHTPDHVSYYWLRESVLFSGDVFNYFISLSIPIRYINYDHVEIKKSAFKLLNLKPKIICIGHGTSFFSVHKNRIEFDKFYSSLRFS